MSAIRPGGAAPLHDRSGRSDRQGRAPASAAHVAGIIAFPLLGSVLALTGMPVQDVLVLLAGCGGIGAAVFAIGGGGRRLLEALAAALNAAAGK
ncbi:hypothetical protein [Streptomyces sp. CMB-StM0423]|uniref:hypothetical protein n=1 Tax=Streptomyces sp. CMB-StM0423 TaxID=2059884 RepID=UPI000C713DC6|nr:hypothetical protein [Streptomyces sp. CMB-StM0423]AUH38879.1 hypothetical protein CXR04_00200 [Streptomyces sp. CMB-StM0423]